MGGMAGKVALITGGTSGIGRAAALAFAREGAKVVVTGRRAEEGEETVRLVREAGGEARFLRSDVAKPAEVEAMVRGTVDAFGRLDYAFNNAGLDGVFAPLVEQAEENYARVMDVNVKGLWLSMKFEIAQMLKQGGGAIVNNSSVAGLLGFPNGGIYVASKHAVIGLTRTAALEYARQGIRVNAVCPAAIQTEMLERVFGSEDAKAQMAQLHPMGRIGRPEEVADAVVWLCSDGASFVTGHPLPVDGGFLSQ